MDSELYGHPVWWFLRASQPLDLASSDLGAERHREGFQRISEVGRRPLGFLEKSRVLSGTHQLTLRPLGWGRGVGILP